MYIDPIVLFNLHVTCIVRNQNSDHAIPPRSFMLYVDPMRPEPVSIFVVGLKGLRFKRSINLSVLNSLNWVWPVG